MGYPPGMVSEQEESPLPWAGRLGWLGVAGLWVALNKLATSHGFLLIPAALRRQMTLDVYLLLMLVVSTALGLALVRLAPRPRATMGLARRPSGRALALAVVVVPAVFVLGLGLGIYVALPTLLEEFLHGGAQVSRQNLGEFGRVVRQQPVLLTALWVVVVAPVGEELLFRGALWGSLRELTRREEEAPRSASSLALDSVIADGALVRAGRWAGRWFQDGGLATIVSAGIFGAMHLGTPGGAGIILVVSSLVLGLALGLARQHAGGLLAPLALHAGYNLLGLGHARNWFVSDLFPKDFGVPRLLSVGALGGLILAGMIALVAPRGSAADR